MTMNEQFNKIQTHKTFKRMLIYFVIAPNTKKFKRTLIYFDTFLGNPLYRSKNRHFQATDKRLKMTKNEREKHILFWLCFCRLFGSSHSVLDFFYYDIDTICEVLFCFLFCFLSQFNNRIYNISIIQVL